MLHCLRLTRIFLVHHVTHDTVLLMRSALRRLCAAVKTPAGGRLTEEKTSDGNVAGTSVESFDVCLLFDMCKIMGFYR